ncbi:hypothetical protein OAC19_02325 [Candidatus Pelagibacter sp.]|nr:hypothetical protein [Candidatus Pelagibacter sp.]
MIKFSQFLKKKLVIIKQTKLWYFFIKFFFIPFFDFIWVYIINFQGRLLAVIFLFKKKNFYKINKYEEAKLIENDPDFQKIAYKIRNSIDENLINKMKDQLESIEVNDPTQKKNSSYSVEFFELLPDEIKQEIVNFAISEKNLVTATKYLKVLPVIKKLIVYLNVPKNIEERAAQLWHKDDFGYKSLDIFLAISDININNGPLYFLKAKNELGVFYKIKDVIKNAQQGERNKISLDVFSDYYKKSEVGALIGKSGTGILIDSFTKYHRGGFCKTENRIMLRISYQTPDSSRGNKAYDSENFYYYPKINKKNVKSIFHQYVFFKYRNKFLRLIKIDTVILFLIKIFHYKK